jgi:hypothetical protein
MKDKITTVINGHLIGDGDIWLVYSRDALISDILKVLEFEALCNPDIYEASANEHFEYEYKEQNQVIEILKGHVDSLQEQLAKRDELIRLQDMSYCNLIDWFENGSVYDHNKERLAMDEQINKLKAEIE